MGGGGGRGSELVTRSMSVSGGGGGDGVVRPSELMFGEEGGVGSFGFLLVEPRGKVLLPST